MVGSKIEPIILTVTGISVIYGLLISLFSTLTLPYEYGYLNGYVFPTLDTLIFIVFSILIKNGVSGVNVAAQERLLNSSFSVFLSSVTFPSQYRACSPSSYSSASRAVGTEYFCSHCESIVYFSYPLPIRFTVSETACFS